jgi:hypothetical protein
MWRFHPEPAKNKTKNIIKIKKEDKSNILCPRFLPSLIFWVLAPDPFEQGGTKSSFTREVAKSLRAHVPGRPKKFLQLIFSML